MKNLALLALLLFATVALAEDRYRLDEFRPGITREFIFMCDNVVKRLHPVSLPWSYSKCANYMLEVGMREIRERIDLGDTETTVDQYVRDLESRTRSTFGTPSPTPTATPTPSPEVRSR